MPAVDRGEGHPANRVQPADVVDRWPPPPRPEGLVELAQKVGTARRDLTGTGRLVLECSKAVAEVLSAQQPEPAFFPSPRITVPAQALGYRQIEVDAGKLDGGAWRLVDDGEVVADGTVEMGMAGGG